MIKKFAYCFAVLVLTGCSHFDYAIKNIKPNEIGASKIFENRIFNIRCRGDFLVGPEKVDGRCRKYMSRFAFEQGYMYFSVLDEDEGSVTHRMSYTTEVPVSTYSGATIYGGAHPVNAYGTSTTYIPETHYYNTTTYYKSYVFVLINADELNRWKNYYKVLDYYQPKTP